MAVISEIEIKQLPKEYQEVEYIESTGTQYIDTNYIPKKNTRVELELSFNGTFSPGTTSGIFFGALEGNNVFQLNFPVDSSQAIFAWADKTFQAGGTICTANVSDDIKTNKNRILFQSGSFEYGTIAIRIATKTEDHKTNPLILFGRSNNGVINIFSSYNMRLYGSKFYENDVLVRNYIPCYRKSDNTVGMYDLVDGEFYTNSGTGEFIAGNKKYVTKYNCQTISEIVHDGNIIEGLPAGEYHFAKPNEITDGVCEDAVEEPIIDMQIKGNSIQSNLPEEYQEVEYIESTGTQYIDTGLLISDGYQVELKAQFTTKPNGETWFLGNWIDSPRTSYLIGYYGGVLRIAMGLDANSASRISVDFDYEVHTFSVLNDKVVIDGQEYDFTFDYDAIKNVVGTLLIGKSSHVNYKGTKRIHGCKLWNKEGVLIRDFVPCYRKSDGVAGLYDLVEGKFYTNQGTGSFIAGNNIPNPQTPIEIESVGEKTKNLFNINAVTKNVAILEDGTISSYSGFMASDFIGVKPNGTYTISILNKTPRWNLRVHAYNKNKEWLSNIATKFTASGINELSFTTTEDCVFVRVSANAGAVIWVQLEENSVATEYEPYGYKVPIVQSSKNLFDYDYIFDNRQTSSLNANTKYTELTLKPNTTYTLSSNCYVANNYSGNLFLTLPNVAPSSGINGVTSFTPSRSVVTGEDGKLWIWTRVNYFNGAITTSKEIFKDGTYWAMLEEGSTATEYEHYRATTINIYLTEPLRKVGNFTDVLIYKDKKVLRYVEVLDDSGTQTIENSYQGLATPTEETIDIPEISTFKGTNVFDTDTSIKPSEIKINYWKQI